MHVAILEDLESVARAGQPLPSQSEMESFRTILTIAEILSAILFWGHPITKSCGETDPHCVPQNFTRAQWIHTHEFPLVDLCHCQQPG